MAVGPPAPHGTVVIVTYAPPITAFAADLPSFAASEQVFSLARLGLGGSPPRTHPGFHRRRHRRHAGAGAATDTTQHTPARPGTSALPGHICLTLFMLAHVIGQRLGTARLRTANSIERKFDIGLLGCRLLRSARRHRRPASCWQRG